MSPPWAAAFVFENLRRTGKGTDAGFPDVAVLRVEALDRLAPCLRPERHQGAERWGVASLPCQKEDGRLVLLGQSLQTHLHRHRNLRRLAEVSDKHAGVDGEEWLRTAGAQERTSREIASVASLIFASAWGPPAMAASTTQWLM